MNKFIFVGILLITVVVLSGCVQPLNGEVPQQCPKCLKHEEWTRIYPSTVTTPFCSAEFTKTLVANYPGIHRFLEWQSCIAESRTCTCTYDFTLH